ncbi:hypothetical protein I2I11_05035 [Pontibacter sp. 172403-2]|uniref:hypothetical protein n=1 Tax=Pontibacter rufus TaxID=2791028 RepID=UPI0018AF6B12|nr:hypothetical protein [Pontibacter sp. 172403-2]MBF9252648.1 hypothetical protein [Pontibacter sp. 172403-2]
MKTKIDKTTLNQRVLLACIICLIWILLYKLLFIDIDNIFPNADRVGEITFNLFCSVIASGIFYYVVVHLENRRIAKILYPSINDRLKTFGVGLFFIKKDLYQRKGLAIPDKMPKLEDFAPICDNIILTTKPPEIIGNPSFTPNDWFEYFEYYFQSDKFLSKQLYTHISFLTPDILKELDEIQYSRFQRALDVYRINKRYNELSGMSGPFWLYLSTLDKLSSTELK